MKHKIKIIDKISDKIIEREVSIPDKGHLDACIKFKSQVFEDKRKKKPKHKKDYTKEEY